MGRLLYTHPCLARGVTLRCERGGLVCQTKLRETLVNQRRLLVALAFPLALALPLALAFPLDLAFARGLGPAPACDEAARALRGGETWIVAPFGKEMSFLDSTVRGPPRKMGKQSLRTDIAVKMSLPFIIVLRGLLSSFGPLVVSCTMKLEY